MPQILVPGVALSRVIGTVSGNPFNLVWHWQNGNTGASWTQAQITELANSVANRFKISFLNWFGTNTVVSEVTAVDIGVSTPYQSSYGGGAFTGAATGTNMVPTACQIVSFLIGARYRGGHPRTYLPPNTQQMANAALDQWLPSTANETATVFAQMVSEIVADVGGITHCAVQYSYTYAPNASGKKIVVTRTGLKGTHTVQGYNGVAKIGTQRRRMGASS